MSPRYNDLIEHILVCKKCAVVVAEMMLEALFLAEVLAEGPS